MVVVDKLSKETHFIPIKTTHKAANNADIFMKEIFCLHGIPKVIISDKDPIRGNLTSKMGLLQKIIK